MKLTSLLAMIVGTLAILFVGLPVFWCPYCNSKQAAMRTACLSNTKQQALALAMYRDAADGRFPDRDYWVDAILPYVKEPKYVFHVPGQRRDDSADVYGYAFNSLLSRSREPKDPEKVPIVYDSVNPIRNASDPVASLPRPGRHVGKNHIAYVDGHARAVEIGLTK